MAVGATGWVAQTEGTVALVAATAKTVLSVIAASAKTVKATEIGVSFDGTTAAAVPVLVEFCRCTQAGAGSGSSSVTPRPASGNPNATVQATAAKNYATTEPTTITPIREWLVHPTSGLILQFPLGREPESLDNDALLLRLTAPAAVNVRAYIEFEE